MNAEEQRPGQQVVDLRRRARCSRLALGVARAVARPGPAVGDGAAARWRSGWASPTCSWACSTCCPGCRSTAGQLLRAVLWKVTGQRAPGHGRGRLGRPRARGPAWPLAPLALRPRRRGSASTRSTSCWALVHRVLRLDRRHRCPGVRTGHAAAAPASRRAAWPVGRSPCPRTMPLAEAVRRIAEAGARAAVVVDRRRPAGRPSSARRRSVRPRASAGRGSRPVRCPAASTRPLILAGTSAVRPCCRRDARPTRRPSTSCVDAEGTRVRRAGDRRRRARLRRRLSRAGAAQRLRCRPVTTGATHRSGPLPRRATGCS